MRLGGNRLPPAGLSRGLTAEESKTNGLLQVPEDNRTTAMPGNGVSSQDKVATTATRVTIFRCVTHPRPAAPKTPPGADDRALPKPLLAAQEVALPCSGRLQPAHLLKAFEAGADAVCVITCAGGDCLYLEGGLRLERRVQYVRGLLDEIGLGGERLLLCELPAETQREDSSGPDGIPEEIAAKLAAVGPSPLRQNGGRRTE